MSRSIKIIILAAVTLLLTTIVGTCFAASTTPNVSNDMLNADYWIARMIGPDDLIMTQEEISVFNKDIIHKLPETVYDLTSYPSSLTQEQLTKLVTQRPFPEEDRFLGEKKVNSTYYQKLKEQMNLAGIKADNKVNYAFTVKRADLRTFPTTDVSFSEPGDWEFDMFQETAVRAAEPVLILHRSSNRQWYFVQVYNYYGWMSARDLAIADNKITWLEYINADKSLVVTGNKLRLDFNRYSPELSELELNMGTKLPLSAVIPTTVDNQSVAGNYVVRLPVRNRSGGLIIKFALIPVNSDVSEGYMPFTRANIIRQAFKLQGERYGWGGMFSGRDCSALVMDVYKSFGFMLPRNSGEQEQSAGKTVQFDSLTTENRYALIDTLLPGAALITPTHEMLYVGQYYGHYYVIHDVTSLGDANNRNPDGTVGKLVLNQVVVTDLSLPRRNGITLVDSLRTGKQFENIARLNNPTQP